MAARSTTFSNLLDPLSGERVAVRIRGGRLEDRAATLPAGDGREVDGSDLMLLPSLYDADAHLPLIDLGLRLADMHRSFAGGVTHMNVAMPWQQLVEHHLHAVVADAAGSGLPRITPVLSVSPDETSLDFPGWLAEHAAAVRDAMPAVCKLYTMDPNFAANLDAVQAAGLTPLIWCTDLPALRDAIPRISGPVYWRHATSAEVAATMRSVAGARVQTSPHFLVPLPGDPGRLVVLPPPTGEAERRSLCEVMLGEVDVIASDHNAPPLGAPDGPGLQSQQHLLPAMLAAVDANGWPLAAILEKMTTAPARVFGTEFQPGFAIVQRSDEPVSCWPTQTADRAPYAGTTFGYRVVAIGAGDRAQLV